MPNVKLKYYLHLHLLVFIAGFTAILGKLITINAIALVWYRMLIAMVLMYVFIKIVKLDLRINRKTFFQFSLAGIIIALHWVTFFESIKQSNISIALAMFSSGAFFASFIEPLFFKRRILKDEILFGISVIIGVFLITQSNLNYIYGIILGLFSALFSTLFAVINGKFIKHYNASIISFYEFVSGVIFLSFFVMFSVNTFDVKFFMLSKTDWIYIFILASVCTAYAFIGAVEVMRIISPYTVILSYNLEPIYGITLALLLFPNSEKMTPQFYIGAVIIVLTVLLDAVYKNRKVIKKEQTI